MKIRPARYEDAPAMARVIVDTFLVTNRGLMSDEALRRRKEEWTYEVSTGDWQRTMLNIADGAKPYDCMYVAENDSGEVIGFSLGCPSKDEADADDVGEIDILYVREKYQRQGIGRALVKATAGHLACLGMTSLHICTPVNHTEGRRFYDRLGGQVVSTRDDYEDGELCVLAVYEWPDIQLLTQ